MTSSNKQLLILLILKNFFILSSQKTIETNFELLNKLTIKVQTYIHDQAIHNNNIYIELLSGTFSLQINPASILSSREFTKGNGKISVMDKKGFVVNSDSTKLNFCHPVKLDSCIGADITGLTLEESQMIKMDQKDGTNFFYLISEKVSRIGQVDSSSLSLQTQILPSIALSFSLEQNTEFIFLALDELSIFAINNFQQQKNVKLDLASSGEYDTVAMAYDEENLTEGSHLLFLADCKILHYSTTYQLVMKISPVSFCQVGQTSDYNLKKIKKTRYVVSLQNNIIQFLHINFFSSTDKYNKEFNLGEGVVATSVDYSAFENMISISTSKGEIFFITTKENTICHINCKSCKSGLSFKSCIECKENFTLKNGICIKNSCLLSNLYYLDHPTNCLQTCPEYYFSSGEARACLRCPEQCISCKNLTNCSGCQKDFFVASDGASCLRSCPSGEAAGVDGKKCRKCHATCKECDGVTGFSCTECGGERVLSAGRACELPNGNRNCEEEVEFFDEGDNRCKLCDFSCKWCFGSKSWNCKKCVKEKFFLEPSSCVDECPEKTFENEKGSGEKICERCLKNCKSCNSSEKCKICKENYRLNSSEDTCKLICSENCAVCSVLNKCEFCQQGYKLNDDKKECEAICPENCEMCDFPFRCKICKENFKITNDKFCKEKISFYVKTWFIILLLGIMLLLSFGIIVILGLCILKFKKFKNKIVHKKSTVDDMKTKEQTFSEQVKNALPTEEIPETERKLSEAPDSLFSQKVPKRAFYSPYKRRSSASDILGSKIVNRRYVPNRNSSNSQRNIYRPKSRLLWRDKNKKREKEGNFEKRESIELKKMEPSYDVIDLNE